MPSSRRPSTSHSGSSKKSRNASSNESHGSQSTTPTSPYGSPQLSASYVSTANKGFRQHEAQEAYGAVNVSPSTSLCPRSSVDSYASTTASQEELEHMDLDSIDEEDEQPSRISPLPEYTGEISEPHARASTPQEFGRLFPSLNRFSIRHDDFTSDGNMNLRVDTILSGRRRTAVQLFHLRMYNLEKRDFSLRRYSRDSGREVCNSKRLFVEPEAPSVVKAADGRPSLQRSVTTAIKTFSSRSGLGRANTGGFPTIQGSRPGTAHSWGDADDEKLRRAFSTTSLASSKSSGSSLSKSKTKPKRRMPTNSIKLEFANYARVDVTRRHQRYDFEWWGHRYSWKRSLEKSGGCSYLLIRDGDAANPVAYIVPEARSPSQVYADEKAGGWIRPCYMWIADESVLDAVTDVADVIMATGLMSLVDDCITERLETQTVHRIPLPLTSRTFDVPRTMIAPLLRRNTTDQRASPLRLHRAISAY